MSTARLSHFAAADFGHAPDLAPVACTCPFQILPPGLGLRWQAQRDTALERTIISQSSNARRPPKAPSPLRSAGALQDTTNCTPTNKSLRSLHGQQPAIRRFTLGRRVCGIDEDWALGGALAAIYYIEPFTTYDADIFFIPKDKGLTAGIPAIYAHLQTQGWQVEREHLLIRGFPVQFLAANGLTEEAVREAERIDYEGVPAKVFRAEHIIAIAASVGRAKDKARIEQLQQQADVDKTYLEELLQRHKLKLPTL